MGTGMESRPSKLGVGTVAELVTYAIAEGLLPAIPFRASDGADAEPRGGGAGSP